MKLRDYVIEHTERNACRCGRCIDSGEDKALPEHTANMVMFDVAIKGEPTKEELLSAIAEHKGEWNEVNPTDGQEHNYLELGGWIGDQGIALQLMGLGSLLGAWRLLTPYTIMGADMPPDLAQQMAGMGMVAIQTQPATEHAALATPETGTQA